MHFQSLSQRIRVAALLWLAIDSSGAAVEPWADSKLPVASGLEVWLDASAQTKARQARNLPAIPDNQPLDVWLDSSGHGFDVPQPKPEARPSLRHKAGIAFVRFDGKDDFLAASGLHRSFSNVTVFVSGTAQANFGRYRGFVAISAATVNDYTSGFNLDLGSQAGAEFTTLNAEGAGFGGAKNLLASNLVFGRWHALSLVSAPGPEGVRLFADGVAQRKRARNAGVMAMDELTVGARRYSNSAEPPRAQSFLEGDLAEVLIYNRALSDTERTQVEKYLAAKYTGLRAAPLEAPLTGLRMFNTAANPPPVQMLVPGFTARPLPLDLPNIDNVKYRADGKLYAVGYDGQIWLLSDTDGDGLEDKAGLFWNQGGMRGPIGLAVTPPGYAHGQGVFVPSKGKLSLIVDTNGDDHADREIIVATGWQEIAQKVDTIGVALAPDGSIYFALGTANYANAYLIDKTTGVADYNLASERGTVQRVTPDFSRRETVCTGVRFPIGMAFNRHGDLFCSEQEGATWLPNGNPFDELLHLQPGRHYGFPPRHPKHLPNVIDEPSVFDYAPQHQSTCGMDFNESVNGGPVFGPARWTSDALVAGESRGKIYRTKLVKTAAGYVAQNQIIGCLTNLTVDLCVSPQGDLVVATHSGKPDWGTGPGGVGRLWKLSYTQPAAPQPVATWSASPTEIRIAFDRPLDIAQLRDLAKRITLTQGKHVQAGDRFEFIRPGYQVVQDQLTVPRFEVPVLGVNVSADRRTLAIRTAPRTSAMNCSITISNAERGMRNAELKKESSKLGAYEGDIDLLADLTGVEAKWISAKSAQSFSGWLPHPDLAVSRDFTAASAEHEQLFAALKTPGTLTLRGQLDLWQMLQPAVQPGAKLDWVRPEEKVTITITASSAFSAKFGDTAMAKAKGKNEKFEARFTTRSPEGAWLPFELSLPTGGKPVELAAHWFTTEDPRPRAFPLRRVLVPWATPKLEPVSTGTPRVVPELAGGNWLSGRKVFFNAAAACGKCHTMRGEGGHIGPDLSNLPFRDYASVLKDIREPSAALNPDHLAYNVELADGDSVTGLLTESGDRILVADASATVRTLPKSQVQTIKPSTLSLMPEGLDKAITPDQFRDLLAFLLTEPLEPAPIVAKVPPPPPRKRAEVEALLKKISVAKGESKPMRIVLCSGPKDHGPGEHDYPLWQQRWSQLLALAEGVTVETAQVWPSDAQWKSADVVAFYSSNPGWNPARGRDLDALLERGGGLAYFHWAVEGRTNAAPLAERIGIASNSKQTRFRHGPVDLNLHPHPLAEGFGGTLSILDETYWNLVGDPARVQLLASGVEDGEARPQMWTRTQGKGRVFVSLPGHYTWTFDDPLFRLLALRGLCWAGGQPMDRLAELALIGARVE